MMTHAMCNCAIVWMVLMCISSWAEVIHFTNGTSMRGRVERWGDYITIRTNQGQVLRVKSSLVAVVRPEVPSFTTESPSLSSSPSKSSSTDLRIYDTRALMLSTIDRPSQPFNLAEGMMSAPLAQGYAQSAYARRSSRGRDTQDIDLQGRGRYLVELITRITGTANWDHAFVMNRLPARDYLSGEE